MKPTSTRRVAGPPAPAPAPAPGPSRAPSSAGLVGGLRVMQLSAASPERPKSRAAPPAPAPHPHAHPPPHSAPLLPLGARESVRPGNISVPGGPPSPPASAPTPGADLVNYPSADDLLLSGPLHKRGAFFRAWLPRHVVLSRNALRVYRRDPLGAGASPREARRLLKDEVLRADALRAEAADSFRNRPYCLALEVRKRPRRFALSSSGGGGPGGDLRRKESNLDSAGSSPAPLSLSLSRGKDRDRDHSGRVVVIYLQASREAERARWLKALQRWIDGADPLASVPPPSPSGSASSALWPPASSAASARGRALLHFVVSNAYQSRSRKPTADAEASLSFSLSASASRLEPTSPTARKLGRAIERALPVLASLVRELHACEDEGELVYILDQVLGEVQDAFIPRRASRHQPARSGPPHGPTVRAVKALVAAAAEDKLDARPYCWTDAVRAAYASVMRALHTALKAVDAAADEPQAAVPTLGLAPPRLPGDCNSDSDGDSAAGDAGEACETAQAPQEEAELSFHRTYKLGRRLGAGGFSVVHIAAHRRTRKQVAVKMVDKRALLQLQAPDAVDTIGAPAQGVTSLAALRREVRLMRALEHPNLVPLVDFFDERDRCYLVTPLCTGGELFDALVRRKTYAERDARALLRKLARAIAYLHAHGVVHRDLKPENILLKSSAPDAEVMIADFGLARDLRELRNRRGTTCGTPGYVAPEVVRGEAYGAEVDCWGLGVILFILLCGYPPFGGKNPAVVLDKVARGAFAFEAPYWDAVSPAAKDLVAKLLTVDRRLRMRAEDIESHPWMAMGDEEEQEQEEQAAADESKPAVDQGGDVDRPRRGSDLLPALRQMREHSHSLTHGSPRAIRASDLVDVDSDDEADGQADGQEDMDRDRELLEQELMGLGLGGRDSLASDD